MWVSETVRVTVTSVQKKRSGGDKEARFDAVRKIVLFTTVLHHTPIITSYTLKGIHSRLPTTTTAIMTDKETSASANTVAASTANPPPAPPAAEAIEEDDEFEEFEPCHWDKRDEDAEDSQQWQVSRLFML